jgi:hypothetical protein
MHRSIFLTSIGVAAALAVWLVITGILEQHAWAIFTSNRCSANYPGSSQRCMNSLSASDRFSSVNAAICTALPAILGLVVGAPLVAGEIQQNTNRLAWTQSITRTRWLMAKVAVGGVVTAGIVGSLAPLIWWWTDAAQRSDHIQPTNFDISGFVGVSYALLAFALGVALGALIRKTGWAFAVGMPIFILARLGIRDHIRPGLVPPATETVSAWAPVGNVDWYLNAGFVPIGQSTPSNGETWSTNDRVMEACQGSTGKTLHSPSYCERIHHLHYVMQFQPPSHFWALQSAESGIFLGLSGVSVGLALLAVRRWRT